MPGPTAGVDESSGEAGRECEQTISHPTRTESVRQTGHGPLARHPKEWPECIGGGRRWPDGQHCAALPRVALPPPSTPFTRFPMPAAEGSKSSGPFDSAACGARRVRQRGGPLPSIPPSNSSAAVRATRQVPCWGRTGAVGLFGPDLRHRDSLVVHAGQRQHREHRGKGWSWSARPRRRAGAAAAPVPAPVAERRLRPRPTGDC